MTKVEPNHLDFTDARHGGLTVTLADAAFGFACNSHGVAATGIDVHMVYGRAVRAGEVAAAMTGTAFVSGKPLGA